jgi:tetratricopeptide (TPR) repeat protein
MWLLVLAGVVVGARLLWQRVFRGTVARASVAYAQGDWPSAIRLGREALREWPDDPEAMRIVARSSARLGRADAAIDSYQKLGEADLQPFDFLALGLSLGRAGKLDDAKKAWVMGLDAGPESAPLLEELGWFLFGKHQYEDAIQLAGSLDRLPGCEARASMLLGNLRATLNDVPGSADSFRRALSLDPGRIDQSSDPAGLRKLIARIDLRADRPAEARDVLRPIVERGPDPEASWLLSRAYLREGEGAKARESLALAGSYRAAHPLENDPGPYVGETHCEKCHPQIYKDSLASRHTQSYYRGDQIRGLPRPEHPLADPDDPKVTHSVEEQGGVVRERTRVGGQVYDAVIEYAFGTSDRYLTTVNRDNRGDFRIARMSYYQTAEGRGWGRSQLDSIHPAAGTQFQGEPVGVRDGIIKCLYCHVTNPRGGANRVGPETADRAIGCERCHGPGGNHLLAVAGGFPDLAIVSPASATPAAATVTQCNDCHILDRGYPESDRENPDWIRSQGVGWTWSRCNTESGGSFGCATCHDPHQSARATTTAHYEAKCVLCHSATDPKAGGRSLDDSGKGPTICPVNPSKGCVGCHMPKTRFASMHLDLSDHYIRVRRKSPERGAAQPSTP